MVGDFESCADGSAAGGGRVPVCADRAGAEKVIGSKEVRAEKRAAKRTLGEALKAHRIQCHMTQEFVAESLGVSRQTVSKWENGSADPSTTNLLAVAKLYDVPAEELLREVER